MAWVGLFEPFTGEGKCAKVVSNRVEKSLRGVGSQDWVFGSVKFHHVVTTVHVFVDPAFTCAAESFNGVLLSLLHLGVVSVLDDGDRLTSMDLESLHAVAAKISNALNWVSLLININLI